MIKDVVADLKADEGFVPHVYDDHLGYATLGYGFLVDKEKGGRIPAEVAEFWLLYEVEHRWGDLLDRLPWLEGQPEEVQRALLNMAYQMGINGVCNFRRMLAALKAGRRAEAAMEALNSTWARQTPGRARRVAGRIRGG